MDQQKKKNIMVASLAIVGIGCSGYWLMPSDTKQRTPGDTVVQRHQPSQPHNTDRNAIRRDAPDRNPPVEIKRPVRSLAQPKKPIRKRPKDRARPKTPTKKIFPAG